MAVFLPLPANDGCYSNRESIPYRSTSVNKINDLRTQNVQTSAGGYAAAAQDTILCSGEAEPQEVRTALDRDRPCRSDFKTPDSRLETPDSLPGRCIRAMLNFGLIRIGGDSCQ